MIMYLIQSYTNITLKKMTSFHPYLFKHQLPLVNAIVFDKHILPKVQYLKKIQHGSERHILFMYFG